MVWLHGGGFSQGSASAPVYDGANLARRGDVVVVGINHRLNVLGYAYLAELGGSDFAKSGNVGILDIVQALQWVRDNIERFGGDPKNVMIFGESGGGSKVCTLLAMPCAKGLFHRAAIQSGPGIRSLEPEAATKLAEGLLAELGLDKEPGPRTAKTAAGEHHGGIFREERAAWVWGCEVLRRWSTATRCHVIPSRLTRRAFRPTYRS